MELTSFGNIFLHHCNIIFNRLPLCLRIDILFLEKGKSIGDHYKEDEGEWFLNVLIQSL